MTTYTREDLIAICERAVVPVNRWSNRDSARSQEKIGTAWALLKAGCDWHESVSPASDEDTIWIEIEYPGFSAFEEGRDEREYWEEELFYLPTEKRLDRWSGKDWY